MRILENLLKEDQEFEEEISTFRWVCAIKPYIILQEINLKTMEKTEQKILFPQCYYEAYACTMPGNKTFCYRRPNGRDEQNGVTFIIDENYKIEVLPCEIQTTGFCVTFYQKFVYMVGIFSLFRYNLIKRRWEKLNTMPCQNDICTCISFNGVFFICWYNSTGIYVFDLLIFSFSRCNLKLEYGVSPRVLCKSENQVYLIDFVGLVWQCEKSDIYNWNLIGRCKKSGDRTFSTKVFYKNSWYFNIDKKLIKFNLKTKAVSETKIRFS